MERFSRKTAASCRKAAAFVASLMGTYYHNIDAKGRMNFPTKLREILGTTFYVTKGLDQPCLTVCSAAEWERLAAKVAAIPESKGGQLRRWLFSGAGVLTPDKQGRVLIPQDLRQFAGLEKDVVLVGVGSRVEIWSKDKWIEANTFDDMEEIAEHMEGLGI